MTSTLQTQPWGWGRGAATSLSLSAVAVVMTVLLAAGEVRADSGWQTLTLIEQHGFSIRLKARKVASLADDRWLLLELENQSSPETVVNNLHYRVEYEAKPVGGGSGWSSGLCQGSEIEVFPRAWDTTPVGRRVLEMGHTHYVVEPLSDSAAATLQHSLVSSKWGPPDSILDVSAIAHFSMSISFGGNTATTHIKTPLHGIPFAFRWEPPDASSIPRLQQRLKTLCKDKAESRISDVRATGSTHLAAALFGIPAVAVAMSNEELNNAAALTGAFNDELRRAAMRCLYERDPTDRRFLDETIRMIRNNPMSVSELALSGFWHTELIGEVVAATRYRSSRRSALRLLEEHRGDWEQNAEIVQQLETIEREFAWQSWWRQYGLLTMVLGILAAVTAIFFACQRGWRRGGATK